MMEILLTLVVAGVLLWAVNQISMQSGVKNLLNAIVLILLILWLMRVFGVWHYVDRIHV